MQSLLQKMSDPNLTAYDTFVNSSSINKQLSNVAFTNKSMEAIYLVPTDESKSVMGTGNSSSTMGSIRQEAWYSDLIAQGGYRWLPTEEDRWHDTDLPNRTFHEEPARYNTVLRADH